MPPESTPSPPRDGAKDKSKSPNKWQAKLREKKRKKKKRKREELKEDSDDEPIKPGKQEAEVSALKLEVVRGIFEDTERMRSLSR